MHAFVAISRVHGTIYIQLSSCTRTADSHSSFHKLFDTHHKDNITKISHTNATINITWNGINELTLKHFIHLKLKNKGIFRSPTQLFLLSWFRLLPSCVVQHKALAQGKTHAG